VIDTSCMQSILQTVREMSKTPNCWGYDTILIIIKELKKEAITGRYDFNREEARKLILIFEEELANRAIEDMLDEHHS